MKTKMIRIGMETLGLTHFALQTATDTVLTLEANLGKALDLNPAMTRIDRIAKTNARQTKMHKDVARTLAKFKKK